MRTLQHILLLGLLAVCCRQQDAKTIAPFVVEEHTPVTKVAEAALEHPSFPLKCASVGADGPGGVFLPVMLLSSPLPRGANERRSFASGNPQTIKIYRGTSSIAASNLFLGEFMVAGFDTEEERIRVSIGFNLTEKEQLLLYAIDEHGTKQYEVHRVDSVGRP